LCVKDKCMYNLIFYCATQWISTFPQYKEVEAAHQTCRNVVIIWFTELNHSSTSSSDKFKCCIDSQTADLCNHGLYSRCVVRYLIL
jgi:hypothetical protein